MSPNGRVKLTSVETQHKDKGKGKKMSVSTQ